ncbi:gliding motility-associated C-terminal domain-containing protein [Marinifilum fragile]|uniref:T9SS type B sorting domain-containing protein n=1 Tax=Marinifilum fragile TaxID=570161 RepID=UPI002AA6516A|nr:gliding motility-associated C-terminal domain-containing protein [Marinifilum fragile]
MFKTLLHKTLLTALLILMGGLAAVAQQYVVKGTKLNFKVDENASYKYHWSVTNTSNGSVAYLASTTFESGDYQFNDPGTYEVKVYPEDLGTHCFGEALTMLIVVDDATPTAVFEDLEVPYVCAKNNGGDTNGKLSVTVNYTGPKPWTFKYSIDRAPAELPEGANEIYTNSFTFDLEIPNTTGKTHRAEILLVEAKTLSGIPVEEDLANQTLEVDVMALPNTAFGDYEPVIQSGTIQAYTATIEKSEKYEIFVPSGATVLNESTSRLSDNFHSQLKFDVQWAVKPGDYQVKLIERSAFDCAGDTVYANVTVVESFSVSLGADLSFCQGESRVLTPEIDFDGTYTYLWSDGSVNNTLEVSETGVYSVTVTDTKTGKQSSAFVNVTVWKAPTVDLGADYQLADTEVLTLDAGNAGADYLWSTGETSQTIQVNSSNTYGVTVTNANGCSASDEVVITSVNDVFAIELGKDQDICVGDEIVLNPNPSISQNYNYLWSNGAVTSTLTVSESGVYSVTVRDDAGNEQTDQVTITVHALPIVDLGDDIVLFDDESATLDAGDGGIGGSYEWLPNGETTQSITVTDENVYTVRVTSAQGCVGTDEISVTKREGKFAVDLGPDIDNVCLGEKIYLTPEIKTNNADFTATYRWTPSESTDEGIYVEKSSKYCVYVTDQNGNTEEDCIEVKFNPTPEVDLGDDIVLANGQVVNLDAGDDFVSYMWYVDTDVEIKPSEINQVIQVSQAGEYRVEVTNEFNCIGRDTINVSTNGSQFNVYLPTAFSPNGDSKNDKLELAGDVEEVKTMSLIIYNRLGHKIFQSVHMHRSKGDGWDGTYKGQNVDMDVYVYFLKVSFKDGSQMQKQGNITLLR